MAIATTSITEVANNGGGTWKDYGGGGGSASNTDVFVTSTGSRARKVSNGVKGFAIDLGAGGTDISADVVSIRWAVLAGVGALDSRTNGGVHLVVEDTSTNESYWDLDGNDTYGGGWKVSAVSMATTPSRNNGTAATLTAARYIGIIWDETAAVGGGDPNCYIDQILRFPIAGVTVTGNSTAFIDDLVDTLDNPANGPYGLWERRAGVVFGKPRLILDPDATDMLETDRTLVLENPVYDAGTTIDSTLDEIGIESTETTAGQLVTFTRCDIISADPDEAVTTDANREFDFTSAIVITMDTCRVVGFDGTVVHLGASGNNFDGTTFSRCGEITSTGATINDGFIRDSVAATGDAALVWNVNADPDGDLDNLFVNKGTGSHHAIEFTTTTPLTMTLRGMTSVGFNAADANTDSTFGVLRTTGTVTINVVGGTGNFSCQTAGATCDVVIDPVDVTVTVVDQTDGTAIQGAIVRAWADETSGTPGPFDPASVSITRSGATATVTHTAHGLATNDVVRIAGVDPAAANEYNGFQTITVTGANTYTYTVSGTPPTPAPGSPTSSLLILNGDTNVSGVVTDQRTYTGDQQITGWARKSTSSPVYIQGTISGLVDSATGFTATVPLVRDE